MLVYKAINAVQSDLAKEGIGKGQENKQQGYKFRGIDDVYNAVSPLLAKHGLCVLPRVLSRSVSEKATRSGSALFYVVVEAEFDFIASEDASKHTIKTYGEAMDSGDKATNKAMSAAYKYALIQTFAIPTEGDNDADATSHELAKQQELERQQAKKAASQPATQKAAAYKKPGKDGYNKVAKKPVTLQECIALIKSAANLEVLKTEYLKACEAFPTSKKILAVNKDARKAELEKQEEENKQFLDEYDAEGRV